MGLVFWRREKHLRHATRLLEGAAGYIERTGSGQIVWTFLYSSDLLGKGMWQMVPGNFKSEVYFRMKHMIHVRQELYMHESSRDYYEGAFFLMHLHDASHDRR